MLSQILSITNHCFIQQLTEIAILFKLSRCTFGVFCSKKFQLISFCNKLLNRLSFQLVRFVFIVQHTFKDILLVLNLFINLSHIVTQGQKWPFEFILVINYVKWYDLTGLIFVLNNTEFRVRVFKELLCISMLQFLIIRLLRIDIVLLGLKNTTESIYVLISLYLLNLIFFLLIYLVQLVYLMVKDV